MFALWFAGADARAVEWCNGRDDDGDRLVDEGPVVVGDDRDGDGFSESLQLAAACDGDPTPAGDCDDDQRAANPAAVEVCDGMDNDCDGAVDEGVCPCPVVGYAFRAWQTCTTPATWTAAELACRADPNWHLASLSATASQGEAEQAIAPFAANGAVPFWIGFNDRAAEGDFVWSDGTSSSFRNWRTGEPNNGNSDTSNEDCAEIEWDGRWDDQSCSDLQPYLCEGGCDAQPTWYPDADGDGLGDAAFAAEPACAAPATTGWVTNALDCDDADPDQPESGWRDEDGDGFGGGAAVVGCSLGLVPWDGDCDDQAAAVGPDRAEIACNQVDDDCDPTSADIADEDGDGVDTCADCDDADDRTFPGAPDDPSDGVDRDCDGAAEVIDSDRDGLPDAEEAPGDADGDGLPDVFDPDSDGDGAFDGADPAVHDPGGTHPPRPPRARWGFGCSTAAGAPWGLVALLAALTRRR